MKCLCFLRFDNDRLMQGAHFRAGRVGSTASPSQSWPAKPGRGRGRGRGGQPFSTERHCPRVHLVAGTTCGPATPKPGALPFRHGLVLKPRGFVPLLPARRRVRPRWPLQTKPLRPRLRVRDGQLVGGCSGQAASRGSLAGSGEVSSPAKAMGRVPSARNCPGVHLGSRCRNQEHRLTGSQVPSWTFLWSSRDGGGTERSRTS